MAKWAVIGTRDYNEISWEGRQAYENAIRFLARRPQNHIFSTGAANGADQVGAEIALEEGSEVELYLPWENYNQDWVEDVCKRYPGKIKAITYFSELDEFRSWGQSVVDYHPVPKALKRGAWALHARNYGIVEGSTGVLALPRPPEEGGTAQGMRIARGLGIALFNLSLPAGRQKWSDLIAKAQ